MRVISGTAKGKKLKTQEGLETRPTSDRTKEALFNILNYMIYGKSVLDLFAGSGALGIEALSRGAEKCVFVDDCANAVKVIKENLENTGLVEKSEVLTLNVLKYLENTNDKFDYIFMDPPYNKGFIYSAITLISDADLLNEDGIIVAESENNEMPGEKIGQFTMYDRRKYGRAMLNFYKIL